MTIDQLYRKTNLTKRAYETCKINNLDSLEALLEYYTINKTFKKLKRCGSKTNIELTRITKYYSQNEIITDNVAEIIAFLNASGKIEIINKFIFDESSKLSVRSYNGLAAHLKSNFSINNLASQILYADDFSFDLLRNIGRKSLEELNSFIACISNFIEQGCEMHLPVHIKKQPCAALDPNQQTIKEQLSTLSQINKRLIEQQIQYTLKHLSKRAYNTLSKVLSDNFTVESFTNHILLPPESSLYNFRGIGAQTVKEITGSAEKIKRFFISLLTAEPNAISGISNRLMIESTFFPIVIPDEIVESLSLFRLVSYMLDHQHLFSDTETAILGCFKIYARQTPKKLGDIANTTGLTQERVRQLKLKLQSELLERFDFLSSLTFNFAAYNIDLSKDLITIDDTVMAVVNDQDCTRFSKAFIAQVLSIHLKDVYICVERDNLLFEKDQTLNQDYYLVKKDIAGALDVNALLKDLRQRMRAVVESTYVLPVKSYLSNFMHNSTADQFSLSSAMSVATDLIFMEGKLMNDQGNLTFQRSTAMKVSDYCIEVLLKNGKPLTVAELLAELGRINTGLTLSLNIIRSKLQRMDDFVPIGRTSTFGLKRWESEMKEFKGGSIRDIVKELLESTNKPLHISEIAAHVKKYRPDTYERSILDNLKAHQSKLFSFYKNSHIGLLSRQYDSSYEKPKPKPKMFDERLSELRKFINIHKRLPNYNRNSPQEISIRRWMDNQIKHHNTHLEFNDLVKIYR